MSTRGGNNVKKGQKYQNTFAFKHNKSSLLTRKIKESPLDLLCKRCLEKLEWRINFRKYKPLTIAGKCVKCENKNVYKAYRTLCDLCAINSKSCSKCGLAVEEYAKPNNWRNDPSKKKKQEDELDEIMKILKERYRRTVERKWKDGEYLIFDREKGIINEDSGEIVVELAVILASGYEIKEDLENNSENSDKNSEIAAEDSFHEASDDEETKDGKIEKETETELEKFKDNPNEINCA